MRKPSNLPERRHSCCGRIETLQHTLVLQTKGALQNHEKRPDAEVTKDSAGDKGFGW